MRNEPKPNEPTPKLDRALWWSLAVGCFAVLLVAAMLEPDARGHGTHAQLGLPPCGFLLLTGAPCPGCGLTTAFAHAIRGHWMLAVDANPFGLLLFAAVAACVPLGLLAGWRRWSVDSVVDRLAVGRLALGIAGSGIALWVVRLASAL